MRTKIGNICMISGTALILAALALFLWNREEAGKAAESVNLILPLLEEQIGAQSGRPNPYDTAMRETEIDGYLYIGFLSVPSLKLELPVMSQWDYGRLKIAPCRYTGSVKTDDLVIAAHNYERHFGKLSGLSEGDEVSFTDMDGTVTRYEVAAVDILSPAAVAEMTSGEYDLTLFTCTYGGKSRVTVRCERVEPEDFIS